MHDVRFKDQPDKADYDFQNLTPGEYTLTIQLEPRGGKGGANWPVVAESRRVTVAAGKTATLDLGFDIDPKAAAAPAAPHVAPNAPAGPPKPIDEPADEKLAIAGRVVDNQGKPVVDALVSLPVGCPSGRRHDAPAPNADQCHGAVQSRADARMADARRDSLYHANCLGLCAGPRAGHAAAGSSAGRAAAARDRIGARASQRDGLAHRRSGRQTGGRRGSATK